MCFFECRFFKKPLANFLRSSHSETVEMVCFFIAFLCDATDLTLTFTKKDSLLSDECLAIIPSGALLISSLLACRKKSNKQREGSIGAAAISFFGTASYLLGRTIVDLTAAIWRQKQDDDFQCENEYEEHIQNSAEIAIELVYLACYFFENKIKIYLDSILAPYIDDLSNYDIVSPLSQSLLNDECNEQTNISKPVASP